MDRRQLEPQHVVAAHDAVAGGLEPWSPGARCLAAIHWIHIDLINILSARAIAVNKTKSLPY